MPKSCRKTSVRKHRMVSKKTTCKQALKDKVRVNMAEMKKGLFKSPMQAVAVSYSQVLKARPHCKKSLRPKKSSRRASRKVALKSISKASCQKALIKQVGTHLLLLARKNPNVTAAQIQKETVKSTKKFIRAHPGCAKKLQSKKSL